MVIKRHSVLPGFGLTLGYTVLYLSLIVLVPLAALVFKAGSMPWPAFWGAVSNARVVASYRLTFGAALAAALVNVVFGFIVAWSLVRYRFAGRRVVDALVDLPFALPTAVSGIALDRAVA
jgi:sulfate transport system permease protein